MPSIRFKVRTMMIVIGAVALLMVLLRWSPPTFAFLVTIFVEITPFLVYYWILQTRRRQFSEGQLPVPGIGVGSKRRVRKSAG
jgi:hypothetical protein